MSDLSRDRDPVRDEAGREGGSKGAAQTASAWEELTDDELTHIMGGLDEPVTIGFSEPTPESDRVPR